MSVVMKAGKMNDKHIKKPALQGIQNIVFDLGNVLLNLDFEASIKAFKDLGMDAAVLNKEQAYVDPVFYELEVGLIDPSSFRERVRKIVNNPDATDLQIDDAWCAMILDIPAERVQLVKKLGETFNVYLFSNTNPIHMNRLHEQFKLSYGFYFSSLFVKDYYSYEIHERKPDLSSYRKLIELSGINPAQTLFIDDLEKNIRGAQDAGIKTFLLKNGMEVTGLF
jgi:putative hydrolase of the HAD superfamily